jgi:CspA family cold shock protein
MKTKNFKGTVKCFNDSKGYGFIACGEYDYFAHYTQIQGDGFKTLADDQEVIFDPSIGPHGKTALNIRKVKNV